MKTLVVEDDFVSRKLLQRILSPYSDCDIAINGKEAIDALCLALDENEPYDVIFMDIMMPEMDGKEALKKIRQIEEEKGMSGLDGVKIIMSTALSGSENILGSFKEGCDGYLVKPFDKEKVLEQLKKFNLIKPTH